MTFNFIGHSKWVFLISLLSHLQIASISINQRKHLPICIAVNNHKFKNVMHLDVFIIINYSQQLRGRIYSTSISGYFLNMNNYQCYYFQKIVIYLIDCRQAKKFYFKAYQPSSVYPSILPHSVGEGIWIHPVYYLYFIFIIQRLTWS